MAKLDLAGYLPALPTGRQALTCRGATPSAVHLNIGRSLLVRQRRIDPSPLPVYSQLTTSQLSRLPYVALAEWGEAVWA